VTYDELVDRTVAVIRALHDLKEDVLHDTATSVQPQFDAGMMEAAAAILWANLDSDDPRVIAERDRQAASRLWRVMNRPVQAEKSDGALQQVQCDEVDRAALPDVRPLEQSGRAPEFRASAPGDSDRTPSTARSTADTSGHRAEETEVAPQEPPE
jgi:hypothetical protein